MNPYNTFAKLGAVNALSATITKKDGSSFDLRVKPETLGAETLDGEYANALQVRVWSANVSDFLDPETGAARYPEQGDYIAVTLDDGSVRVYSLTRSVSTARFWDWLYSRPGYRIRFYTKYEGAIPAEPEPEPEPVNPDPEPTEDEP